MDVACVIVDLAAVSTVENLARRKKPWHKNGQELRPKML